MWISTRAAGFGVERRPRDGPIAAHSDRVGDAGGRPARVDDMIESAERCVGGDIANRPLDRLAPGSDCTLAHEVIEDMPRHARAGAGARARACAPVRRDEPRRHHGRVARRVTGKLRRIETEHRELVERGGREPVAAGLVAGKPRTVQQRHRDPARGEVPAGGSPGGTGADDGDAHLPAGDHGCGRKGRELRIDMFNATQAIVRYCLGVDRVGSAV